MNQPKARAVAENGRNPVLDEVKKGQICAILAVGCSRSTAAKFVGCAVDTIRNTAGRDSEFDAQLKQAESKHEVIHLKNIQAAGKKYWRASAWALERLYPARYGTQGSDSIAKKRLTHVLDMFATIIAEEVPVAKHRANIMARLSDLTVGLLREAQENDDT